MKNILEKFTVIGVFAGFSIDHSLYSVVVVAIIGVGVAFVIKKF